jgi:hypothetical protein
MTIKYACDKRYALGNNTADPELFDLKGINTQAVLLAGGIGLLTVCGLVPSWLLNKKFLLSFMLSNLIKNIAYAKNIFTSCSICMLCCFNVCTKI